MWFKTDAGYIWGGPGPAPGCGPDCCGGCRYTPPKAIGGRHDVLERALPNILSNYVTKQELESALNDLRGVCGMSIDKENSARCNRSKGHLGFCDKL